MDRIKEVAFNAARQAGALLKERLGNIKNIDYKSAFNIVTDVDKASEQLIIGILRDAFPNDQILAEETGAHAAASTRRWYVDPLDGTSNYAHGYPFFSVSIGLEDNGQQVFGAVFNPISNELFWAASGKGAYLNEQPIKCSKIPNLSASMLATGFASDTRGATLSNMEQFSNVTDLSHGVRRDGSAALDLSFVACGRFEGFWELKLAPWDLSAGTLIVREAGGKVTNLSGGPFDIHSGHVIATNSLIHDELIVSLAFAERLFETAATTADLKSDPSRK